MSQSNAADVSAPPRGAEDLVCTPSARVYGGDLTDAAPDYCGTSSRSGCPGHGPNRTPLWSGYGGPLEEGDHVLVPSSDGSDHSCHTAASDAPRDSPLACGTDGAARRPPPPPTAARPLQSPQCAGAPDVSPGRRSNDSGWGSPGPHRSHSNRQVEAWLAQMPRSGSDSSDGDGAPRSPAGGQHSAEQSHLQLAASGVVQDFEGSTAAANGGRVPNAARRLAEPDMSQTANAPEPLHASLHAASDVGIELTSEGVVASVVSQQRLQQTAESEMQPEQERPPRGTAPASSGGGTADVDPAQLALAVRLAAPASARDLHCGGGADTRLRRKRRAVALAGAPPPLGLGRGSGLPAVNKAGIAASSSKVGIPSMLELSWRTNSYQIT